MMNHGEIVSFIWGVADLIRDTFKRGRYQDVILPLTVLRRIDSVLAATKEKVRVLPVSLHSPKNLPGAMPDSRPSGRCTGDALSTRM